MDWGSFNLGDSVVVLEIDSSEGISGQVGFPPSCQIFARSPEYTASTLECISRFRRLETLVIKVKPEMYTANNVENWRIPASQSPQAQAHMRTLRSILTRLQPLKSAGLSITIHIPPGRRSSLGPASNRKLYEASRIGFLNIILGEQMAGILSGLSPLRHLKFTLWDNTPAYGGRWWQAQMVHRLPSHLHSALSVEVELHEDGTVLFPNSTCLTRADCIYT